MRLAALEADDLQSMWKSLTMQQEKVGFDNYLGNVVYDDIIGQVLTDFVLHVEL